MESIKIWLNGNRNYAAGVKLYCQFGSDALLKRVFQEGESDFKKKKLLIALEGLLSAEKKKEVVAVVVQEKQIEKLKTERTIGKGWSEKMDEVETALYNKWKPQFLEMMDLTSRLDLVARAGQRDHNMEKQAGMIAHRILDLDDICDELYERRDQYIITGKVPVENPYGDVCIDAKLMPTKLKNHERYVREFKNKLKNEPDNVSAAENLKKHEWFVAHYKKELNLP